MSENFLARLLRREMTKNKEGATAASKTSSKLGPQTVGLGFRRGDGD